MHFRNAFTSALALSFLWTVSASHRARAADEKEACLSAADQGQSLRDDGKYSSAREQFVICSRGTCPKLVHDQCVDWLRQLDESMPTVVFSAKDDQGNDVPAVHVVVDGKAQANGLDRKPVPLDPGPHDVSFATDSSAQTVSVHIVLRAGEKAREVGGVFQAPAAQPENPSDQTPPTPTVSPVPPPTEAPETPPPSTPLWTGRSITSLSLLAAGVASVGLGVYFGLQSQSEASQADSTAKALSRSECKVSPADPRCNALGDARDAQNTDAVLNIALYVGGGVLAASAVATWFLWPKPEGEPKANTAWVAPIVGTNQAGVRVGGTF
jgi:hypothetical protein